MERPPRGVARLVSGPFRAAVLRWYLRNRRDLPWRRTTDPYAIWVSEIMLQQTRVESVIPYYERFLRRFHDLRSLSRARESDVLAAWSGLGYYSRARNLHTAARMVVRERAGRLPEEIPDLKALPGIGAYTAAAVASIAYGREAAAVDGNVTRVLARIHGLRGGRSSPPLKRAVAARAEALARGPRPGDWTQALMELGARICLPREPLCRACPAARFCAARRSGHPDRYPEAAHAKKPRVERRILLAARAGPRFLLVRDPDDSFATWTLPHARLNRLSASRAARMLLARHLDTGAEPEGPLAQFRHRTFSRDTTYEIWTIDVGRAMSKLPASGPESSPQRAFWVTRSRIRGIPLRAHTLKALRRLAR